MVAPSRLGYLTPCLALISFCLRNIDVKKIFELIEKYDVTHFGGAPIILNMTTAQRGCQGLFGVTIFRISLPIWSGVSINSDIWIKYYFMFI